MLCVKISMVINKKINKMVLNATWEESLACKKITYRKFTSINGISLWMRHAFCCYRLCTIRMREVLPINHEFLYINWLIFHRDIVQIFICVEFCLVTRVPCGIQKKGFCSNYSGKWKFNKRIRVTYIDSSVI